MNTISEILKDKNEMMQNLEAIKGENYAKFVDMVCLSLSGYHGAMALTQRSTNGDRKTLEMMDVVLSATMTGICTRWADHLDLDEETVKEAMDDATRLVSHVDSQLEHVKGVHDE